MKYEVNTVVNVFLGVTVDADNPDDALVKAYELCKQKKFSVSELGNLFIRNDVEHIRIIDAEEECGDFWIDDKHILS